MVSACNYPSSNNETNCYNGRPFFLLFFFFYMTLTLKTFIWLDNLVNHYSTCGYGLMTRLWCNDDIVGVCSDGHQYCLRYLQRHLHLRLKPGVPGGQQWGTQVQVRTPPPPLTCDLIKIKNLRVISLQCFFEIASIATLRVG